MCVKDNSFTLLLFLHISNIFLLVCGFLWYNYSFDYIRMMLLIFVKFSGTQSAIFVKIVLINKFMLLESTINGGTISI